MEPVLIDTGFIVAMIDSREAAHRVCLQTIKTLKPPFYTCEAVIVESCYLLSSRKFNPDLVLGNIERNFIKIAFDLQHSLRAIQSLLAKYADTPADFADACLIQMADELNTGRILTLDSDFQHYRWRKNKRFQLLVPLK